MIDQEAVTQKLLSRAAEGDALAVEDLMSMHRGRLHRMVSIRLDNRILQRVDASDVVQETLTEAARQLPNFLQRSDGRFYPWLRQIAWERLIQIHRQHLYAQKRTAYREAQPPRSAPDQSKHYLLQRVPTDELTPSQDSIRRELSERLRDSLRRLGDRDREVLELRYVEHLSIRQVANRLGLSEAAAQSRHRRAVERLHDLLAAGGHA